MPPHRILLIGTGGGMCCIRVAAYLTAWRDAGLERAVDHAITVSGSGGAMGAYLSGLPHRAVQMFEHLAVSGFVTGTPGTGGSSACRSWATCCAACTVPWPSSRTSSAGIAPRGTWW